MSNQDGNNPSIRDALANLQRPEPAQPGFQDPEMALLVGIEAIAAHINEWARRKGFWDLGTLTLDRGEDALARLEGLQKSQKLMLMVSELGEALEALRKNAPSDKIPGFTGEEEELADCVIRILDHSKHYNLRLGQAIIAKIAYNEGRPFRHGKEF